MCSLKLKASTVLSACMMEESLEIAIQRIILKDTVETAVPLTTILLAKRSPTRS